MQPISLLWQTFFIWLTRQKVLKIKQSELDDYIDDCDDIEALFDEVIKELSESNAGKLAMQRTKEKLAKQ
jgi:Phage protein.